MASSIHTLYGSEGRIERRRTRTYGPWVIDVLAYEGDAARVPVGDPSPAPRHARYRHGRRDE